MSGVARASSLELHVPGAACAWHLIRMAADSAESPASADWQLMDDSMFLANIEPWPPRAGAATLKAEATLDDWEQKFAGSVSYRVASSADGFERWQPMPKVREDAEGSVYFETPVTLNEGQAFLQFRVMDSGDTDFTELTDWSIEVE